MNFDHFRRLPAIILAGLLSCYLLPAGANTTDDDSRTFQSIIHNLEYISVDYAGVIENGRIVDQGEYEEHVPVLVILNDRAFPDIEATD